MTHDAHGAINDVLQNGFETPATYCNLLGGQRGAADHFLSESPQEVEGGHAAQKDNLVYAEFARRQTLDIQIRFEFAVELFAGAVIMI